MIIPADALAVFFYLIITGAIRLLGVDIFMILCMTIARVACATLSMSNGGDRQLIFAWRKYELSPPFALKKNVAHVTRANVIYNLVKISKPVKYPHRWVSASLTSVHLLYDTRCDRHALIELHIFFL